MLVSHDGASKIYCKFIYLQAPKNLIPVHGVLAIDTYIQYLISRLYQTKGG